MPLFCHAQRVDKSIFKKSAASLRESNLYSSLSFVSKHCNCFSILPNCSANHSFVTFSDVFVCSIVLEFFRLYSIIKLIKRLLKSNCEAVYFYNKSGLFLPQKRYIFIPFNSEIRFSEKRGSPKFRLKQCLMIIACLITFAK